MLKNTERGIQRFIQKTGFNHQKNYIFQSLIPVIFCFNPVFLPSIASCQDRFHLLTGDCSGACFWLMQRRFWKNTNRLSFDCSIGYAAEDLLLANNIEQQDRDQRHGIGGKGKVIVGSKCGLEVKLCNGQGVNASSRHNNQRRHHVVPGS